MNICLNPSSYYVEQNDGSVFILPDADSQEIVSLEGIYAAIFSIISEKQKSLDEILDQLQEEVDAPREVLFQDLTALTEKLKNLNIISAA